LIFASGGTMSGTTTESGNSTFSYQDSVDSSLDGAGDWGVTSATGSTSGADNDYSSYSGGATY
jgi:hypothetical protein